MIPVGAPGSREEVTDPDGTLLVPRPSPNTAWSGKREQEGSSNEITGIFTGRAGNFIARYLTHHQAVAKGSPPQALEHPCHFLDDVEVYAGHGRADLEYCRRLQGLGLVMRYVLDSFNLNAAEKLLITEALAVTGSIVEAAKLLGVTRHGLKRRIIKHRVSWPPTNTISVRAPKVFISYSHDSHEHSEIVLLLAHALRKHGIDAMIDQFILSPPEGWPRWIQRQIEGADHILVICTGIYRQRFEGREIPAKSHDVAWEGVLTPQIIYSEHVYNRKFVPILIGESDIDSIPLALRPFSRYRFPEDLPSILRHLTGQPEVIPPPLGPRPEAIRPQRDFFLEQRVKCTAFFERAKWHVTLPQSSQDSEISDSNSLFAEPKLPGERRRVSGIHLVLFRSPPKAIDIQQLGEQVGRDQIARATPVLGVLVGPPPREDARTALAQAASKGLRIVSLSSEWMAGALARGRVRAELDALLGAWVSRDDPFAINLPVIAPGDFFPRRRDAETIMLSLDRGQSVGIFGLRKIGKTSLARWVLGQRLGVTVEVDAQRYADRCGPLLKALPSELLRAVQRLDPDANWPIFDYATSDLDSTAAAIGSYIETMHNLVRALTGNEDPITLYIDEIDRLVHIARRDRGERLQEFERLFGLLRALGQRDPPVLITMISGFSADVTRRDRALGDGIAGNPVYRYFTVNRLGPMERDVLGQMMGELGARAALELSNTALDRVMYWSGGHPWLARQIGSCLLRSTVERTGVVAISAENIDSAAAAMLADRDACRDLRELLHRVEGRDNVGLLSKVAAAGDDGIALDEIIQGEQDDSADDWMLGGLLTVHRGRCRIFAGLLTALIQGTNAHG